MTLLPLLFSSSYVASIYLSKHARIRHRSRDDKTVIQARLVAVSAATVFCCLVFAVVYDGPLTLLGLTTRVPLLPSLVTPLLFTGPLYASGLPRPPLSPWIFLRNYVVAPLTEELVFRSCIVAAYSLAGTSMARIVWLAPMWFGLAHVHHAWEVYNTYGRTGEAVKRAVGGTLFQLSYTTLFGALASFLFLRTHSLVPSLTAHVWCNLMGVPQLAVEVRRYPQHKSRIYTAYLLGVVLFALTLGPWTRAES